VAATTSCLISFNLFLPFVDHFPASLQLCGHKLPEMSVIDEKMRVPAQLKPNKSIGTYIELIEE
jgi:hypothetical protein